MQQILTRRVQIAWLLMVLILGASTLIIAVLFAQGADPSNAVLIETLDDKGEMTFTQSTREAPIVTLGPQAAQDMPTSILGSVSTPTALAIYVSGAVESPGVYTLPTGSRVNDALIAAGGATDEADLEQINLAAYVSDQQHVRVPKIGESVVGVEGKPGGESGDVDSTTQPPVLPPGVKLNLNSATALELEALPGVGPVLAARIVADRDTHGPFRSVEEIMRVPGIKEGLLSRFKEYVIVLP
jgi:competence protein ComEA